jgi:hypothetical protein
LSYSYFEASGLASAAAFSSFGASGLASEACLPSEALAPSTDTITISLSLSFSDITGFVDTVADLAALIEVLTDDNGSTGSAFF